MIRSARSSARLATLLALGVSSLALGASPAWAEFRLNVLHLNDPHSRIEPINRFDSTCSAEDDEAGECFGGFARLKTAIEERREALGSPTVVISAGDHFQGSLFYTTYKGAGEAEMAEAIGVELFTVGNHEFDDGPAELAAFLDGVSFPVLGANVDASGVEGVEGRIDPYVIAEFDDGEGGTERVGFVGVVASDTAETSSPGPIGIGDDLAALEEAVAALGEEGVNKIIAVTHVGLARDRELAAAVPEIDLIIGGHSHTLLSNTEEGAEPYPVVVGGDTPIVQAYAYGKYLGELVLRFDDEGNLQSLAGDPILIDASFEKDEALDARIQEMLGPIEELKAMVVGETTAPIDGDRTSCRAGECEMGNLVADAMLARVADQGIEVAIQNGGGLRASIDAGEVTMGEVLTVLPFQNTLATFRLSGADIVASLENGVSQIEEGAGRFPQVAGMSFAFDPAAEPGGRVSDVMVGGEPIDPERMYGVVSNNFMRGGGDGYELFETGAEDAYDFGPGLEQVLADHIAATGPITPSLDGRIRMVDASDAMAADADAMAADADAMAADAMAADANASDTAVEADEAAADAELEAADAAEAINEAVEQSTDADALAAPPAVEASGDEDGTPRDAADEIVEATDEPEADTEAVQDAVEEVAADADEAGANEAVEAINDAVDATVDTDALAAPPAVAQDDEADAAEEIVEATPEPVADAQATQEAVEAAANDVATDAAGAAEAINEAVEESTEFNPLAEPPAVEAASDGEGATDGEAATDGEGATGSDAAAAVGVSDAEPMDEAAADAAEADGETAAEAIEEAVPAPSSDTDEVEQAVEDAAEAASGEATAQSETAPAADETSEAGAAVDAINDAVEATTEGDALADAPAVEGVEAAADADAAAETEATDAINDAVDATTDADALAEPPTVEVADAEGSDGDTGAADGTAADDGAADAINEAVEESTPFNPLAEPPVVAGAETEATNAADATDGAAGEAAAASGDASASDAASGESDASDAPSATDAAAQDGADAGTNADPAASEPRTYTVESGDTLWEIAREVYGDPRLYTLIEEANEVNAGSLRPGTVLTIPDRPE